MTPRSRPRSRRRGARPTAKLLEAIAVLTDAARLGRPRLQFADSGEVVDDLGSTEQADWAEFVTLALAGAAANFGGVNAILAGRSGSWEAEGVRQLLYSTVGADEAQLWQHRTDPMDITLYVDELLVDRTDAWRAYDAAQRDIDQRYEAATKAAEPEIDYSRYVWEYDRNDAGEWIPRDPAAAPTWSIEAWRAAYPVQNRESRELMEAMVLGERPGLGGQPVTTTHLPKSPEALAELARLEADRDARLDVFGDLEEQLEQQRLHEWTAYGEALKTRVEAGSGRSCEPGRDVADGPCGG